MKKLIIAAAVLALSTGVNAQNADEAGKGYGGLTTATLTAMGISAAVAAAIISNNRGSSFDVTKPITFTCNPGDAAPVNGVCTNNSSTVVVTGTGTNTSTTTVPVVTTYVAIPQQ